MLCHKCVDSALRERNNWLTVQLLAKAAKLVNANFEKITYEGDYVETRKNLDFVCDMASEVRQHSRARPFCTADMSV